MQKKISWSVLVSMLLCGGSCFAQLPEKDQPAIPAVQEFRPLFNLSLGYGFPNVDQSYLPAYLSYEKGPVTQSGPFTFSLNYQPKANASAGIMVTRGTVKTVYQNDDPAALLPRINAKIDSWSIMANFVRYVPGNSVFVPYMRAAVGVNLWTQHYTDSTDTKAEIAYGNLPSFAYQGAIGVKVNAFPSAGVFLEAGYGKYILRAGVSFNFKLKERYRMMNDFRTW